MNREEIKKIIWKKNKNFYFLRTIDGTEYLCEDGFDIGLDITDTMLKFYPDFGLGALKVKFTDLSEESLDSLLKKYHII